MRHARPEDLDRLEDVLVQLRTLPGLIEKTRGVFYFKSRAFLHFHEDPKGLFADLREAGGGNDFDRIDVTAAAGQQALVKLTRARLTA
jgi:hypothetical protein